MAQPKGPEIPDKVWLPWVREGPYLVRDQHLVAKDEDQLCLSPVPIGRQVRGLTKLTMDELEHVLAPQLYSTARHVARQLVEGRPVRLILRDERRAGRSEAECFDAVMALCRAGLVLVFLRNRRRASPQWELRHAELSNWGRAVLISLDAVMLPGTGRFVPVSKDAVSAPARNGEARVGAQRGAAGTQGAASR